MNVIMYTFTIIMQKCTYILHTYDTRDNNAITVIYYRVDKRGAHSAIYDRY